MIITQSITQSILSITQSSIKVGSFVDRKSFIVSMMAKNFGKSIKLVPTTIDYVRKEKSNSTSKCGSILSLCQGLVDKRESS